MDLSHLQNSEVGTTVSKITKGRVVLQGDIVKDDSASCAVFAEQGSSARHMTAAKEMDIISRLPGSAGQAADAVSAHTQVKMEDAPSLLKNPKLECPDIRIRLPKHKWPKSPAWKTQSFFLSEICTVILWQEFYYGKFQIWNAYSLTEKKDYSCLCMWMI